MRKRVGWFADSGRRATTSVPQPVTQGPVPPLFEVRLVALDSESEVGILVQVSF